ncbi:MAG: sialidase family protein [Candidatus Cybelea sp.]
MKTLVRSGVLAIILALSAGILTMASADVQVNSVDNNSPTLGNETTESETYVARSGSLAVIGYNTSRQAGLLGLGGWNSLSGFAYSTNSGASFTDGGFVPAGSYTLEGDPSLVFDSSGTLYYSSLLESSSTGDSYIGVNQSTSTSGGITFANPVVIAGPSSTTGGFEDKEFLAVDTTGGTYNGRVYVGWSDFGAGNPQAMLAASSSTSPLTFSPTVALAPSASSFQHGVIPVVAPDGSVYAAWSTLTSTISAASATINLVKSTNGGASFGNPDPSDPNPTKTVASFTSTTGLMTTGSIQVRTRTFPYLAIDDTPPGSPTRGNMYVVFQAQPSSSSPTPRSEIFFTSSTDSGKTWSAPRNITSGPAATLGGDTTTNDNWLPAIAVSPVTGHIKVLLYSRREDPANQMIRVYEAGSTDAGMTWYNRSFSAVDFTPSTGYDPLLVSTYMGDYESAFADSAGLLGAWGDTRNLCAPPGGATNPCSPSGRGDQDAWSNMEADSTGADLAITPWGDVTGVGPLWESPDIFVVNSSGVQENAQLGVVNLLQARIRNLGNTVATGAVVRFRFAPWYASIPDSAFELIGTETVNVPAGGAPQIVPINWNLTNLSDTNGGIWPGPISAFNHFCVRVDIEYPSDINLSNNAAQTNFFDVTTSSAPLGPFKFIIGNPNNRAANLQLVTEIPSDFQSTLKAPIIDVPAKPVITNAPLIHALAMTRVNTQVTYARTVARGTMAFEPNELAVGTLTLTRPPASVTQHLTHDLVVNIDSVVDGKIVGGFSVLLARANVPIEKASTTGTMKIVSEQVAASIEPQAPSARTFDLTAPVATDVARTTIKSYLAERQIPVVQDDARRGLISSGAVTLSNQDLLNAIPPQAHVMVPAGATGKYYVTFKTESGEEQAGRSTTHVVVSVRIIVLSPKDLDSPLGGRIVPSNGSLEQSFLDTLNLKLR